MGTPYTEGDASATQAVRHVPALGLPMPGALAGPDDESRVYRPPHFIAGPENALVASLIAGLLEPTEDDSLAASFSPITLYGPSGVGKTHLARALVEGWKPRRDDAGPPMYRTAADYAREFAETLETRTILDFHAKYRDCPLLAIDDIDALQGKAAVQEDLAALLDNFERQGGTLVITLRCSPAEMPGLERRLAARLAAGLQTPIAPPAREARRALLKTFTRALSLRLDERSTARIADKDTMTAPELWGLLRRVQATAKGERKPIADAVTDDLNGESSKRDPTAREIVRAVAKRFSVRVGDITGASRRRPTVIARAAAMYLMRQMTAMTLTQIGDALGGKDHRTVTHALRKTEDRIRSDEAVRQAVAAVQRDLLAPVGR